MHCLVRNWNGGVLFPSNAVAMSPYKTNAAAIQRAVRCFATGEIFSGVWSIGCFKSAGARVVHSKLLWSGGERWNSRSNKSAIRYLRRSHEMHCLVRNLERRSIDAKQRCSNEPVQDKCGRDPARRALLATGEMFSGVWSMGCFKSAGARVVHSKLLTRSARLQRTPLSDRSNTLTGQSAQTNKTPVDGCRMARGKCSRTGRITELKWRSADRLLPGPPTSDNYFCGD